MSLFKKVCILFHVWLLDMDIFIAPELFQDSTSHFFPFLITQ